MRNYLLDRLSAVLSLASLLVAAAGPQGAFALTPFVQTCAAGTTNSCTLSPAVPNGKVFVVQTVAINAGFSPAVSLTPGFGFLPAVVVGITTQGVPFGTKLPDVCLAAINGNFPAPPPCIVIPLTAVIVGTSTAVPNDAAVLAQSAIYEDAGNTPTVYTPTGTWTAATFSGILEPAH